MVETISAYAWQSNHDPLAKINPIANEAMKVAKENLPADTTIKEVKIFFSTQKNNILLYLLAELNTVKLLNDATLDDKTNKMEGAVKIHCLFT